MTTVAPDQPTTLEERVIIVTGAGSGFGRLVSNKAASQGARIVGCDIDETSLGETIDAITAVGGAALAVPADVTKLSDLVAVVEAAVAEFGQVDAIINNAGVMPLAFLSDHAVAAEAWDRCIDINIKGVLHGMIAVHDQMISQGRGHIINVGSIYGNYPVAGAAVYGATKAAVETLSGAVRNESQGKIKVTLVKPTGVPGTNLGTGVINGEAITPVLGANRDEYFEVMGAAMSGTADAHHTDVDDVRYAMLDPSYIADAIIYALVQPWGVSVSDITVRATGDRYVL